MTGSADALGFAIGTLEGNGLDFTVGPPVPAVRVSLGIRGFRAVHLEKVGTSGVAILGLGRVLRGSHGASAS